MIKNQNDIDLFRVLDETLKIWFIWNFLRDPVDIAWHF